MIKNSFLVCGITTSDPEKVRNDDFLKKIMINANANDRISDQAIVDDDDEDNFADVK